MQKKHTLRIGMILDKTFPPDPRVENEAIELINAGHEVFLFCLNYHNQKSKEVINGINVVRYKSNLIEYKLSALAYDFPLYSFLMKRKIKRFLKENKINSIHIHDIRIAEATFKTQKNTNLPIILDLHDNFPEIMKFYPHMKKFPGKYIISPKRWKKKEEYYIKKSNKVITVSGEFKEEIVKRTKVNDDKVVLVPNTINQSFYNNYTINSTIIDNYKDKFVLLYLGDTNLRRGLLTAIESINKLKNVISNIKLVIVGKNTTDYILKEKVNELKLNDYVDFEGWKNVDLFQSYILTSSICISPLYRNIQHDVAYANKLFQYMSFGKPLLVSNATAQKNLIERINSGLVHEEKNVDDFINKVITLYKDISLRNELGKNGEQFVKNEFTWDKTSKELIDLYNNLLH
ncbi:glycosyltransferase family 4 protein [Tenacibaculum sp. IB213877]|uniref:glycosyltransferase family 4 protein n=1 Tax=Tenacibaculum sp. IB213877 TaxID=3097351 RepID=UPI002A5A26CF|nr:glycosyltransferase family 4 protein [Tenacibaculum sp. IB213877]MDY0781164.1 glycosyltransferase family 4 protein [Tenacibaculum sp. IB213877]